MLSAQNGSIERRYGARFRGIFISGHEEKYTSTPLPQHSSVTIYQRRSRAPTRLYLRATLSARSPLSRPDRTCKPSGCLFIMRCPLPRAYPESPMPGRKHCSRRLSTVRPLVSQRRAAGCVRAITQLQPSGRLFVCRFHDPRRPLTSSATRGHHVIGQNNRYRCDRPDCRGSLRVGNSAHKENFSSAGIQPAGKNIYFSKK